jgi:multicomponent Na+:H+ antiporter subunit D
MNWFLVAPVVLPFATAALLVLLGQRLALQRVISVASTFVLLTLSIVLLIQVAAGNIFAVQAGNWSAPFGITFVADPLSAIMVVINGIMAVAVAIYALKDVGKRLESLGYHPLYHVLLGGINGAFLTGDLFNLYVWFEVLLIASFVLLTLGGRRAELKGGLYYVLINLFGSLTFLAATGILYGLTGTLNMADLSGRLDTLPPGLVTTAAFLFFIAFGIKAAVFPLFFWLPASYHTPPVAVSAIFAAMLTKVGVYALIRSFTLLFDQDTAYTHTLLLIVAALTMLTGVLGAAAQNEIRKILSFHIISQIGYMIMGLALLTPLGMIGAVFYLVHHIIVKANLFLISGLIKREGGSFDLGSLGGLYQRKPWLAVLFLIPAFSLAGFPPLSGFWAKLFVIRAGLEAGQYLVVAVSLVVGLLTIYSMTKIWQAAFWSPQKGETPVNKPGSLRFLYTPVISLALLTLMIGFFSAPFFDLASSAATGLLEPSGYLEAVLGGEAVLGTSQPELSLGGEP